MNLLIGFDWILPRDVRQSCGGFGGLNIQLEKLINTKIESAVGSSQLWTLSGLNLIGAELSESFAFELSQMRWFWRIPFILIKPGNAISVSNGRTFLSSERSPSNHHYHHLVIWTILSNFAWIRAHLKRSQRENDRVSLTVDSLNKTPQFDSNKNTRTVSIVTHLSWNDGWAEWFEQTEWSMIRSKRWKAENSCHARRIRIEWHR